MHVCTCTVRIQCTSIWDVVIFDSRVTLLASMSKYVHESRNKGGASDSHSTASTSLMHSSAPACTHVHVHVLCCFALFVCLTLLASFFLPSHLSFKNMYMYILGLVFGVFGGFITPAFSFILS